MRTYIPFVEPMKVDDKTVEVELYNEIEKTAKMLDAKPEQFGARYELKYIDKKRGWLLSADVYTDEEINSNKK